MTGIVVKLAFIYLSTNRSMVGNRAVVPTYRISMQVYPVVKFPHASVALSEIGKTGEASPILIIKTMDRDDLVVKAQPTKPK
jgi:hypothetical protein